MGTLVVRDDITTYSRRFMDDGFVTVPDVIDEKQCEALARHVDSIAREGAGSRTLLDLPWCSKLAQELRINPALQDFMPIDAVGMQCTLFDKSPLNNWLVALHQDLSIPVKRRVDSLECSGWSEKEGRVYVQPPVAVLEQLVAVRIHVDDCPAESGALRVVPKSHKAGRLDQARAEELRKSNGEMAVPVARGGALVMRPLILHASSKATSLGSRRVLHFVFGPPSLPLALEWRWAD